MVYIYLHGVNPNVRVLRFDTLQFSMLTMRNFRMGYLLSKSMLSWSGLISCTAYLYARTSMPMLEKVRLERILALGSLELTHLSAEKDMLAGTRMSISRCPAQVHSVQSGRRFGINCSGGSMNGQKMKPALLLRMPCHSQTKRRHYARVLLFNSAARGGQSNLWEVLFERRRSLFHRRSHGNGILVHTYNILRGGVEVGVVLGAHVNPHSVFPTKYTNHSRGQLLE